MAHRGANDSRSSSRDAGIDDWVVSWFLFEVKVGWMEKEEVQVLNRVVVSNIYIYIYIVFSPLLGAMIQFD